MKWKLIFDLPRPPIRTTCRSLRMHKQMGSPCRDLSGVGDGFDTHELG